MLKPDSLQSNSISKEKKLIKINPKINLKKEEKEKILAKYYQMCKDSENGCK